MGHQEGNAPMINNNIPNTVKAVTKINTHTHLKYER